jgi:serine/threonine-protein kinase
MSSANWTTRFLVGSAQGGEVQPAGQRMPSASDATPAKPAPRAAPPSSLVGSRVGAYLITKRLGAGGVGEVFKGVDVMLKREVAIKVLRHDLACDPLFLERFRREAQLHAKLSHPNVASVHAFLHEGEMQFMVMEYVAGVSLDEFVRSGGPVPVERALSIFRRALDGIEHAHSCGIVHRDIKPANIMLADCGQVKVMDFGIARALDSQEHLTRHGHVAGTAKALAPEQIRGGQADVRSDVYSLGIVLYTLLAGRPPFDGGTDLDLMKAQLEQAPPPLQALVDNLPPKVEAAVMRALEKDPCARFQSVAAFSRALDACMSELATALPPAHDQADAQTSSRTVVNPALSGAQWLPGGTAGRAAAGPQQRPRPAASRMPKTIRHLGAVALAVLAYAGVAALLQPHMAKRQTPNAAALRPVAAVSTAEPQSPPLEAAAAPRMPAPALQESATVAASPQTSPQAIAEPIKPRSLAIVRLPADDGAAAAGDTMHRFKPGERIKLQVTPSRDAHVYCYLQDEARRIVRFYPNRFSPNALVKADTPLEIPGRMRFELVANTRGLTETVVCFASDRDLLSKLPPALVGTDFEKLAVASLDDMQREFARIAADDLAQASFQVAFK